MSRRKESTDVEDLPKATRGLVEYDDETRKQCMDLYAKGVNMSQISRELQIPYKTIRLWVKASAAQVITLKTKLASRGDRVTETSISKDNILEHAAKLAPQDMEGWELLGEKYAEQLNIEKWQAQEITKAIALGIPERLAVGKGAITTSEFDNWIKLSNRGVQPYRDWISFLTIAQMAAISDLIATIRDGHAHVWQGAAWQLARIRPEYFHKDVIRDQHNNALSEMDDEILQRAAREWITGIDTDSEHNKNNPTVINIDDFNLD